MQESGSVRGESGRTAETSKHMVISTKNDARLNPSAAYRCFQESCCVLAFSTILLFQTRAWSKLCTVGCKTNMPKH